MDGSIVAEMRAIWEKSLLVTNLDLNDDFFDIGGNSLYMVVVHQRINERFGVKLGMHELFRNPTINLMSELVDAAKSCQFGALRYGGGYTPAHLLVELYFERIKTGESVSSVYKVPPLLREVRIAIGDRELFRFGTAGAAGHTAGMAPHRADT